MDHTEKQIDELRQMCANYKATPRAADQAVGAFNWTLLLALVPALLGLFIKDANLAAIIQKIVELLRAEFPLVRILVRSFDRQHAVELVRLGAEYQVRETFESAMRMGRKALALLGVEPEEAEEIIEAARRRDADRFQVDLVEGVRGGSATDLLIGNVPARPS